MLGDAGLLLVGDVLGHRASQLAVLLDQDVGKTLGAALLRPLLPRIELATRLGGAAFHDNGADVLGLEHAEGGVLEELGALHQRDVEAQVRLVRAVLLHRLLVGHARDRSPDVVADQLPQLHQDLFGELDDVVLVHEAGLNV